MSEELPQLVTRPINRIEAAAIRNVACFHVFIAYLLHVVALAILEVTGRQS
jgi:hypothetical protein